MVHDKDITEAEDAYDQVILVLNGLGMISIKQVWDLIEHVDGMNIDTAVEAMHREASEILDG